MSPDRSLILKVAEVEILFNTQKKIGKEFIILYTKNLFWLILTEQKKVKTISSDINLPKKGGHPEFRSRDLSHHVRMFT